MTRPIRVAILNDYELVVAGVAAALAPFAERIHVVEVNARMPLASDVDLVLYDTFGQVQGDAVDLVDLVRDSAALVVVFSWNLQAGLVERSLAKGAAGYLSKTLPVAQLVASLEAVAAGEVVVARPDSAGQDLPAGDWPGREHGLSVREAEVLALITQGLSNLEIAERSYLSINSVKTYIRTAYRKIGVARRAQAVVWGMQHGLEPDRTRHVADKGAG